MIRQAINNSINFILNHKEDWSFLYRTQEILSESGEDRYALQTNFSNLLNAYYDGVKLEIFHIKDISRYRDISNDSPVCATITQLTQSPFANVGYIFPTYGASQLNGIATAFDSRCEGKFIKSNRDGELYRIKTYTNANRIILAQEYKGTAQAGRVSVYSDDLTVVYGNPHVTNFVEDMVGNRIQIEGNLSSFQILSVDVDRQVLTINGNSNYGTDLIFSIQDGYEIDPPGQYILQLVNAPDEDDKIIAVDYYAYQTPLTGDNDSPLIPVRFHQMIVYFAIVEYGSLDGDTDINLAFFQQRGSQELANFILNENPMRSSYDEESEPDVVRHSTSDIVR